MKILLIEPDSHKQRQLRTILTSLGHRSADIEAASDRKTATSLVRKKKFDCSFLTMEGAGVDAVDFLKDVRTSGSSRTLPIIVYSNEVTKEKIVAAHEAGSSGFVSYPFSVSDIESAMDRATKK